jgi:DNA-binding GntR family transcriptional regulator
MRVPAGPEGPAYKWQVIADDLQDRIENGELEPGTTLVVARLAEEYSEKLDQRVREHPVTQALQQLVQAGLIWQPTRGHLYTVRIIYRHPLQLAAFTTRTWEDSVRATGRTPSHRWIGMEIIEASEAVAGVLRVRPGDGLFARSVLWLADARPMFLMTACYTQNVAMNTTLISPKELPGGDEVLAAGRREDVVAHRLIDRGPTRAETRHLSLTGIGTPVIEWIRYGFERAEDGSLLPVRAVITTLRGDANEIRIGPDVLA